MNEASFDGAWSWDAIVSLLKQTKFSKLESLLVGKTFLMSEWRSVKSRALFLPYQRHFSLIKMYSLRGSLVLHENYFCMLSQTSFTLPWTLFTFFSGAKNIERYRRIFQDLSLIGVTSVNPDFSDRLCVRPFDSVRFMLPSIRFYGRTNRDTAKRDELRLRVRTGLSLRFN